jgi:hypothetical protein
MKVTDLRKKLLAALAAAGMLSPGMARAANFNSNLVVNPGFENVNLAVTGGYNAPLILDWTPSSVNTSGFAYSHDGSTSCSGCTVPDYARSGTTGLSPPPNSGHWYFTSNRPPFAGVDYIDAPGEFYQDINVSTGDSTTFIAANAATFNLSAWMSSYHHGADADFANAQVQFRSSSGASLGTAWVSDSDPGPGNVWNLNSTTGTIPVGTATVRLSLYGTKDNGIGAGPDGYIDNVDLHLSLAKLAIVVDRSNGNITLKNLTGGSVNMSAYSITSAFEGMSTTGWTSIADNYDAGSPGPNQVDAAHNWTKLTAAGAHTDLSEADLDSSLGTSILNNQIINLGNADWIQNPHEDLVFQYISGGSVQTGIVAFTGNSGVAFKNGDFNLDGVINSADWTILRTNQLSNLSGQSYAQAYRLGDLTGDKINDNADFVAFKSLYEAANGSGSFASMLAASLPEPSSMLLVFAAGTIALPVSRRRSSCGTYKIIFANS